MPGSGERAGLGFTVADDDGDQQVGIVESRAERMRDAVAEFTAFVDRPRRLGRAVAADAAREREFLEELPHAFDVFALVRVGLGIRSFQVRGREHAWRAVPGAREEDRVQVVLVDQPVQVHVGEAQAGAGAPVAEQPVLDVRRLQWLAQQRIVLQVDHARSEIIAGAPVSIDLPQVRRGQFSGTLACRTLLAFRHVILDACVSPWSGGAVRQRERRRMNAV